jgi:hypothetical protein
MKLRVNTLAREISRIRKAPRDSQFSAPPWRNEKTTLPHMELISKAVLSTLRESLGRISLAWESGRTESADIVTWSDFKFAHVEVSTDEDWSYYEKRAETKEFWEIPYEIFKLDLLDFDPNEGGSSEARSSVFVSPDRVEAAEVRRKGDRFHRIYRVRIPRPPAWSTIRPQGLMRVVGLTAASSLADAPELCAKLEGLRVRSFVWDTNDNLLGDQDLLAMARCVSPRQAIAWAISCKLIGFTEIAEGLALAAVARQPVEVGFEHTSSVTNPSAESQELD